MKNHYETLGVSPTAAVQVIRESYQLLSQSYATEKLSGDVTSVDSKIAAIDEAYSILTDSEARAEYDKVYKIYISHQDFDLLVLKDTSSAGKVKKHFFHLFSRLAQLYECLRRSSNRWMAVFCGIFLLFGCALFLVYEGNNLSGLNSTKSTSRDETRQKFEKDDQKGFAAVKAFWSMSPDKIDTAIAECVQSSGTNEYKIWPSMAITLLATYFVLTQ